MKKNQAKSNKLMFYQRHKLLTIIGVVLLMIILSLGVWIAVINLQASQFQKSLDSFYDTSNLNTNGPVGEVMRSEPINENSVEGGSAQRIIYRTQKADGTPTFSSAMVFVPSAPSSGTRRVVAWAHGTLGMGEQCAPSRTEDPVAKISWVNSMLANGWVVVATDYAGLGTPGTEAYLIGQAEAHDVLNSVRAARNMPNTGAGNTFALWGHSQGGHSALFSASLVSSYAPELNLVGTVASAPAAELIPLMSQQYQQPVSWVIGPEVAISWPANYPELSINDVLTQPALNNYQKVAQNCIEEAALIGIVRGKLGQQFFTTNLADVPSWNAVMQAQTAPTLKPSQPVMIAESLTDNVVLPNTTALYIQKACQAGSNLNSLWLTNVNHIQLQSVISPSVINWINDRFSGKANSSTCNQPLPIAPAQ